MGSASQRKARKKYKLAQQGADKVKVEESSEEQKRLAIQKEVQQLVVKLKKKGKDDATIKEEKFKLKSQLMYSTEERREIHKQRKEENKKRKAELFGAADAEPEKKKKKTKETEAASADAEPVKKKKKAKEAAEETVPEVIPENESKEESLEREAKHVHELVIIPIIWRGRHDSKQLLEIAEATKKVLRQQDVDAWIDARRQHTPGQKFAFWEHKGTKFRIEIGPKDIELGRICLCKHPKVPGDYQNTEKKYVPIPPDGVREMLIQFKKWGLDKLNVVLSKDEDEERTVMEKVADLPKAAKAPAKVVRGDDEEENFVLTLNTGKKKKASKK